MKSAKPTKNDIKSTKNDTKPAAFSLWPFLLGSILVSMLVLHQIVFSNFDSILNTSDKEEFLHLLNIRSLKLFCLLDLTVLLLILTIKHISKRWIKIPATVFIWLFLLFYSAELYLCIYPPSQGNDQAYIANIWFRKYWQTNNYGFRDKNFRADELKYRNDIILYLGDSFAAGHGIKKAEDRTSNLLETLSKQQYYVINTGRNGLGTRQELGLLQSFPATAKYVILSHVANDIEDVLPKDETYSTIYQDIKTPFSDFVFSNSRNSVFLDLVYHFSKLLEFQREMDKTTDGKTKKNPAIYDWYKNDTVYEKHEEDLLKIAHFACDTMGAKFILVTYPENYDIDSCDKYINQKLISSLPANKNIYTLNLTALYKSLKPSKLRVNMLDNHPSKLINKIVADSIYQIINKDDDAADKGTE